MDLAKHSDVNDFGETRELRNWTAEAFQWKVELDQDSNPGRYDVMSHARPTDPTPFVTKKLSRFHQNHLHQMKQWAKKTNFRSVWNLKTKYPEFYTSKKVYRRAAKKTTLQHSERRCFGSREGHINQTSWEDGQLAGFGVVLSLADFPLPHGIFWAAE